MRLIRMNLSLAFTDAQQRTADSVANELVRYAVDGQEAQVAYTTLREQTDIVHPDVDYEEDTTEADNKWQEVARNKLEELEKPANSVTLTMDRNDLGQIIDGLTARAELYDETERHFNGEVILGEIAECNDAEEAHAIAEHYRRIIAQLEAAR